MPIPDNACANCADPVKARRPSRSGKHFCSKSACQTAKQRFYREKGQVGPTLTLLALIRDLASLERSPCVCGLPDALPGWAHRDAPGSSTPCYRSGSKGAQLPDHALDAIHPDRAPALVAEKIRFAAVQR